MNDGKKDRRLIAEEYKLISPTLALVLGLNGAVVLQQVHYWLQIAKEKGNNFKDGCYWTYNSIRQWQEQFPWWSEAKLFRVFKKLEEQGILITANYNRLRRDRTKWYSIDYEALQNLLESRFGKNEKWDFAKMKNAFCSGKEPLPNISPNTSVPNNSSSGSFLAEEPKKCSSLENPSRTITFKEYAAEHKINDEEVEGAVLYYMDRYREITGKEHMKLKPETWEQVVDTLLIVEDDYYERTGDIGSDKLKEMIDHYFKKVIEGKFKIDTPCITHFNSEGVKKIAYFELFGSI